MDGFYQPTKSQKLQRLKKDKETMLQQLIFI